jgi:hypothetical protein
MGNLMNMNASTLLWGLLFSSIGMVYFIYGKHKGQTVTLLSGIVMIAYTFFISSPILIVIIGIVLMAIPFFIQY